MTHVQARRRAFAVGAVCLAVVLSPAAQAAPRADFHRGGGPGSAFHGGEAPTSVHVPGAGAGRSDQRGYNSRPSPNDREIGGDNSRNYVTNSHNINNINIDVDNRWDGGGWGAAHPVAAGVAVGAAAATVGSVVYSLPPSGCAPAAYPGGTYYQCGSVWYQPQFVGTSTNYLVVGEPR